MRSSTIMVLRRHFRGIEQALASEIEYQQSNDKPATGCHHSECDPLKPCRKEPDTSKQDLSHDMRSR